MTTGDAARIGDKRVSVWEYAEWIGALTAEERSIIERTILSEWREFAVEKLRAFSVKRADDRMHVEYMAQVVVPVREVAVEIGLTKPEPT